ncbi:DUF874 domain-containing protein [Sulfitobacter alexandrii]|uniref:DUF874 domain-containing protein n=1 Tax=Sulfitobacter alexandrii TaxID=1917485 RepID=A0A1J0WFL9_9RHOB|nr:DUF874 domain-containing protein [Sulfitobacter alexandrii]APE42976.1 DUF874 domain-containing protein [Sulfitobacter alexandrii]
MGPIYSLADFLDMVRRRIGIISFVFIAGCFLSLYWALSQPHVYESAEVIQIEQPKIAGSLAPSTVEASSARRLQLIQQQLMARDSLSAMIEKFDLFADLPALRPSEKVDLLRRSVTINGVAATREGFADDGTIAVLTITARLGDPEKAQAVAHEFADRTRDLAAAQRREQTRETLEFFSAQEDQLIGEIARLDEELAAYRSANDISIEGSLEFVRSEIASINDALLELDREIIATQLARSRIDRNARAETIAREEADLDAQIDSLTTQRELLQDRRAELAASIETTPEVEQTLTKFQRRMEQLQGQLDVIATRRNEAEVGFSLENAARGERLTTLEEARVPDYPISMSRKKRAAMGAAASLMLGLGLAFLLELRRPVIRTARQMERETGLVPVVSIPEVGRIKRRSGLSKLWQDRAEAGQRGRNARLARQADPGQG